jgi:hypothetical protein
MELCTPWSVAHTSKAGGATPRTPIAVLYFGWGSRTEPPRTCRDAPFNCCSMTYLVRREQGTPAGGNGRERQELRVAAKGRTLSRWRMAL